MAMGTGTSSPGSAATAGPCVPTSSGGAATSATTSPGGVAHAGIPLGSVEIDNGGIPLVIAPTPSLYSSTAGRRHAVFDSRIVAVFKWLLNGERQCDEKSSWPRSC
jgi:hypothetical protein